MEEGGRGLFLFISKFSG